MKVYLFYLVAECPDLFKNVYYDNIPDDTADPSDNIQMMLYGFTKDKKKRKLFKKSRNMNLFEERVWDDVSEEEYAELNEKYGYAFLEWVKFRFDVVNGVQREKLFLLTNGEKDALLDQSKLIFLESMVELNIPLLNDVDILKDLFDEELFINLKILHFDEVGHEIQEYLDGDLDNLLPFNSYDLDAFSLYETTFGFTFKDITKGCIDEVI